MKINIDVAEIGTTQAPSYMTHTNVLYTVVVRGTRENSVYSDLYNSNVYYQDIVKYYTFPGIDLHESMAGTRIKDDEHQA